jgi:hypothetical protein
LSFSNYQKSLARCWWLTIVILATQEAEIRQIVQSQPRKIVLKTLSKKTHRKKRAGGVAQSEDPGLKPQHCKKKKKTVHEVSDGNEDTTGNWTRGHVCYILATLVYILSLF